MRTPTTAMVNNRCTRLLVFLLRLSEEDKQARPAQALRALYE
jgi:hypothetical protein